VPFATGAGTQQRLPKIIASARNINAGPTKLWSDVKVPPHSPIQGFDAGSPIEQIELVPFGATNIRVSVFPTVDK
jgi:hypothetical protein